MRIDRLPPEELAHFLQNLATLLSGTEINAINPAVRAELLAELGVLPATIAAKQAAAVALDAQRQAAYSSRNESIALGVAAATSVRKYLASANAPEEQWDLCGFDKPGPRRAEYIAQTPTDLVVGGYKNGDQRKIQGKQP